MQPCSLLSLATAVPPHVIEQADAKARAREAFGGKQGLVRPAVGRVRQCRDRQAPHRRAAGLVHEQSTAGTTATPSISKQPSSCSSTPPRAAIEKAGLAPDQIDGVVTVSTTGIATPSLEARVGPRIGLRDDVRRVPVFGLGCAGGVNGLALAARLAAAEPGSNWLFVTVETCSISIRLDSDDPAAVVATALFGDGAAAAVVTSGEHSLARIAGSAEKLWPNTQRIMGWDVEDPGLAVVFDRAIPPFIEAQLAGAVDGMCADLGIERDDIAASAAIPAG